MRLFFDAYASGHIRVYPALSQMLLLELRRFTVSVGRDDPKPYTTGEIVWLAPEELRVRSNKGNTYRALTAADKRKVVKAHPVLDGWLK